MDPLEKAVRISSIRATIEKAVAAERERCRRHQEGRVMEASPAFKLKGFRRRGDDWFADMEWDGFYCWSGKLDGLIRYLGKIREGLPEECRDSVKYEIGADVDGYECCGYSGKPTMTITYTRPATEAEAAAQNMMRREQEGREMWRRRMGGRV